MRLGAALIGALLTILATPTTWPLGLATFLLRGGILLVVLPIVVLPSPVGLGNVVAPVLITVVLGGPSPEVVAIVSLGVLALIAWIVGGGLVAATLEADGARLVAGRGEFRGVPEPDLRTAPRLPGDRAIASRILAARVLAHTPTGIGLVWGAVRLVAVTYGELTRPADVSAPIVVRVVAGAPEVVIVLAILWTAGEVVGGLAARRIALAGVPAPRAIWEGARATLRHPLAVLAGFLVPTVSLLFILTTASVAAAASWGAVRVAMRSPSETLLGTLAVLLFVSLWLGGLLLIAVTAAWRAAVWSVAHGDLWPQAAPAEGSGRT